MSDDASEVPVTSTEGAALAVPSVPLDVPVAEVETPVVAPIETVVELPEELEEAVAEKAAEPASPVPPPAASAPTQTQPSEIAPSASHGPVSPVSSGGPQPAQNSVASILKKGLETIRFRKKAKLERIVALAKELGNIKNDDVEKLLHCSDATASRYLLQLVHEGRLRRIGAQHQPTYEVM